MLDPSAGPIREFRACSVALADGRWVLPYDGEHGPWCREHDRRPGLPPRSGHMRGSCIRAYRQVDVDLPAGPRHGSTEKKLLSWLRRGARR